MLALFTKQPESVELDDVNQLTTEGFPEGSAVEYKESLPNKKGGQDPWYSGASQIRDYARNEILKEVVAFSNSHGGHVLIGIEESKEKPPRAVDIQSIPRCGELAEKLRLQARDCIEPQLPMIDAWGVETDPNGNGVVIVRVPRSRAAPHRLIPTKECYYRHADRSEKMTMREIQDLTLQRERGLSLTDSRFDERRDLFYERYTAPNPSYQYEHQIRATLIPVSTPLWIDTVYQNNALSVVYGIWKATGAGKEFVLTLPRVHLEPRPILGGVRYTYGTSGQGTRVQVEILRDGTIEYLLLASLHKDDPDHLFPEWVLGLATNGILMANRFRECAGVPEVEYGLEVETKRTNGPLVVERLGAQNIIHPSLRTVGEADPNPLRFQRLSIGPPEEFSKVISILFRDLMNAAGEDPQTELHVII